MLETLTDRNFALVSFQDANGVSCSLQESSKAGEERVWLGCDSPNPQMSLGHGCGWINYKLPSDVVCTTRMHLNRKQVAELLPYLQMFVKTGLICK